MDSVPNIVRDNLMYRYILTNFYPEKILGQSIIFKRGYKDIFLQKNVPPDFLKSLQEVDLRNIPRSEGLYKSVSSSNPISLPATSSANTVIKITPTSAGKPDSEAFWTLKINTSDGLQTTVNLKPCQLPNSCLFRLSNLPLFFTPRSIVSAILTQPQGGLVEIIELPNSNSLW